MIETGQNHIQKFRSLVHRFAVQTGGVAAVEFALILPILIVLFLGSVELTNGLTASRKMSQVASTVGDLVSQYRTLDCATLTDIFKASSAIMTPYDDTSLVVSIAGVEFDSGGAATVDWSRTNGGGSAAGLVNEIPAALQIADSYLIVAKTDYNYQALFTKFSQDQFGTTSFAFSDVFFLRPRIGSEVSFSC